MLFILIVKKFPVNEENTSSGSQFAFSQESKYGNF
jgi:hypothetical protein